MSTQHTRLLPCLTVAADLGVDPIVVEVFRLKISPAVGRRVQWRRQVTDTTHFSSLACSTWQTTSAELGHRSKASPLRNLRRSLASGAPLTYEKRQLSAALRNWSTPFVVSK